MAHAYTFIRKDLQIQHQLVQACHSALEAGSRFHSSNLIPSLVLCSAENEVHLNEISLFLDKHQIKYHKFFEPDNDMGYSSITTEPLSLERKKVLSNFKLWRA